MADKKDKTPEWKKHQGKNIGTQDNKERKEKRESQKKEKTVKIKMLTDYRDVARAGQVWETDEDKAKELVDKKRAEYI